MYIIDKKTKQGIVHYIKYKYGVEFETNRIYVFYDDYTSFYDMSGRIIFYVRRYKGYFPENYEKVPEEINAKDVLEIGMLLERKDKINKIKSKYEQNTI
jgi:hypothetical protein